MLFERRGKAKKTILGNTGEVGFCRTCPRFRRGKSEALRNYKPCAGGGRREAQGKTSKSKADRLVHTTHNMDTHSHTHTVLAPCEWESWI